MTITKLKVQKWRCFISYTSLNDILFNFLRVLTFVLFISSQTKARAFPRKGGKSYMNSHPLTLHNTVLYEMVCIHEILGILSA